MELAWCTSPSAASAQLIAIGITRDGNSRSLLLFIISEREVRDLHGLKFPRITLSLETQGLDDIVVRIVFVKITLTALDGAIAIVVHSIKFPRSVGPGRHPLKLSVRSFQLVFMATIRFVRGA